MGMTAFVFPGQGAQYPGMGASLYAVSPAARAVFDQAERFAPGLQELCFHGDAETLAQTRHTQPCLFTMGVAAAAALRENGIVPDAAAGFSLGELCAVTVADMLPFEESLRLVLTRGEAMQACAKAHPGAMAAVLRLSAAQVEGIAFRFQEVYPVNYNSPGQTVVAMAAECADAVASAVQAEGGRFLLLPVRGAFHCPFMQDAAKLVGKAAQALDFRTSAFPVYANATAEPYPCDAAAMLAQQIIRPVRWQLSVERMIRDGVDTFIEAGAGRTLSGLIRKIHADVRIFSVQDEESLRETVDELGRALC